jgi:hypothetical protein
MRMAIHRNRCVARAWQRQLSCGGGFVSAFDARTGEIRRRRPVALVAEDHPYTAGADDTSLEGHEPDAIDDPGARAQKTIVTSPAPPTNTRRDLARCLAVGIVRIPAILLCHAEEPRLEKRRAGGARRAYFRALK